MTEKKELIRVLFLYNDGSAQQLTGDNLEKWIKACNWGALTAYTHNRLTGLEDVEFIDLDPKIVMALKDHFWGLI